ncbi:hypothetical protein BH09PAT1_BH09PAT1_2350 [soil metagenome]
MAQNYELNEKDIETVLNILKQTDPEHATPEMAIEILEHLQKGVHELSHTDPGALIKIYEELKKSERTKN